MTDIQKSLVLIKPDAVQRELVGEVITRFERRGLKMVGMKLTLLDEATLTEHYGHLADKPFFADLKKFMMQTPVVALVLEGLDVVNVVRAIVGSTNPREADVGTIRADLSMNVPSNIIHASDSVESAEIEIKRFFNDSEVIGYDKMTDKFHFGEGV